MMKKVILGLIAAAAMTSCIKREDVVTTQNSSVGSGTITGKIWAKTDYLGDTLSNGNGDFDNSGVTGIAGATVVATYSTSNLDADNINDDTLTVIGTTDANGSYSLAIPATGEGTYITVYVDYTGNMSINHDCAAMGFDNSGSATSVSTSHEFSVDTEYTTTVHKGQTYTKTTWLEEADDALNTCY